MKPNHQEEERELDTAACTQVVFDLPKRLQAAIKNGTLEVAVDTYAEAAPLLKKYGHKVSSPKWQSDPDAWATGPPSIDLLCNWLQVSGHKDSSARLWLHLGGVQETQAQRSMLWGWQLQLHLPEVPEQCDVCIHHLNPPGPP